MAEKFNLKWNDFQSNVSESFGLFRNESYLHDVTLVSDDYKQIPAHKLVLSACSEYFRNILMQTKQSQPLLCLDGVSSADIQNVLDYVYEGEVKIYQEDLDRFLNVAQKLKLEGLMGQDDDDTQNHENEEKTFFNDQIEKEQNFSPPFNEKVQKPRTLQRSKVNNKDDTVVAIQNDYGDSLTEEEHIERLNEMVISNEDGSYSCKECGKTFQTPRNPKQAKFNVRRHVEIHIDGLNYSLSM